MNFMLQSLENGEFKKMSLFLYKHKTLLTDLAIKKSSVVSLPVLQIQQDIQNVDLVFQKNREVIILTH